MALPGETIRGGGSETCSDCNVTVMLGVYQSAAGYYIGTMCNCGPYSRESGYYPTKEAALQAMINDDVSWRQ